mmetsp:Transcript_34322/g.85021  ORF Transcript_34322/g.85021 Transcript_34322/m.85021 type:complete len:277 (-) Transcript_34322:2668-3498(-)
MLDECVGELDNRQQMLDESLEVDSGKSFMETHQDVLNDLADVVQRRQEVVQDSHRQGDEGLERSGALREDLLQQSMDVDRHRSHHTQQPVNQHEEVVGLEDVDDGPEDVGQCGDLDLDGGDQVDDRLHQRDAVMDHLDQLLKHGTDEDFWELDELEGGGEEVQQRVQTARGEVDGVNHQATEHLVDPDSQVLASIGQTQRHVREDLEEFLDVDGVDDAADALNDELHGHLAQVDQQMDQVAEHSRDRHGGIDEPDDESAVKDLLDELVWGQFADVL